MLGSVLAKTIRDARRGLVAWSVGLAGTIALTVSIYPTVRDNPQFEDLSESYPEELQAFFGGQFDLTTAAGYLDVELYSFMVPLLLLVQAIGAGARAIAGEEEAGTLDLLLANPVSRERVAIEKLGALVALSGVLAVVLLVAVLLLARAVSMEIGFAEVASATLMTWLIAVAHGALALLVGAATGSRGLAIALATAVAVAGYLLEGLGNLVDFLEPLRVLSPFHWYTAPDPLRGSYAAGWAALLVAVTLALALAALPAFERRDIGVRR